MSTTTSSPAGAGPPTPPARRVTRSADDRLAAGVCGGIGEALGVDPTLVRLGFALLAFAGGAGVVLYLAAWLVLPAADDPERPAQPPRRRARLQEAAGIALLLVAALMVVRAVGLLPSAGVIWPAALVVAGLAVIWRSGAPAWAATGAADERLARGWARPGAIAALRLGLGAAIVASGLALFIGENDAFAAARDGLLAALVILVGVLLVTGPWLWRLLHDLNAERTERIRSQERAEMAARVHDSVLQTLALIQREAGDQRRVSTLARQQERELRGWLYGNGATGGGETLASAIDNAAAEVEGRHGVRVEVARSGDCPRDDSVDALVLAAREAMANAARWSGAEEVSVYVEAGADGATVFVRDRGRGFDRAAVPGDRRGLAESIEGRMDRHGGTAAVHTSPGEGTEVELVLPRRARAAP